MGQPQKNELLEAKLHLPNANGDFTLLRSGLVVLR
jgi:hypothetical protein